MGASFRVLVAVDQAMVRGAIASMLDRESDFEVVAQVASGDLLFGEAERTQPDVALVDLDLPGYGGPENAWALREQVPGCKVVFVAADGRPGQLREVIASGASGFLVKDSPAELLAVCLRRVIAGERVIEPPPASDAPDAGQSPLTPREREVLAAAACGATVADIARRVHLAQATVRNYLSAAIGKTGTRNRIEALRTALRNGWL